MATKIIINPADLASAKLLIAVWPKIMADRELDFLSEAPNTYAWDVVELVRDNGLHIINNLTDSILVAILPLLQKDAEYEAA